MATAHYTTQEIWRPVPGWEDAYEVSSFGQVRSMTRAVTFLAHGHPQTVRHAGRILKGALSGRRMRYRTVNLWKENRQHPRKVYHLVLLAFIGPRPPGTEANHIDGNPSNNVLSNLEWVTPEQNKQHARTMGKANGNKYRAKKP